MIVVFVIFIILFIGVIGIVVVGLRMLYWSFWEEFDSVFYEFFGVKVERKENRVFESSVWKNVMFFKCLLFFFWFCVFC